MAQISYLSIITDGESKLKGFPSAGAALLRLQKHVQSEPWLQAESDASWELHSEDSGHLTGWERILDRAHLLLRPGPQ